MKDRNWLTQSTNKVNIILSSFSPQPSHMLYVPLACSILYIPFLLLQLEETHCVLNNFEPDLLLGEKVSSNLNSSQHLQKKLSPIQEDHIHILTSPPSQMLFRRVLLLSSCPQSICVVTIRGHPLYAQTLNKTQSCTEISNRGSILISIS